MKEFLLVLTLLFSQLVMAQKEFTISGYVKDKTSGETIIDAFVMIDELGISATSNSYGFYSLTVPAGEYHIRCIVADRAVFEDSIAVNKNTLYNINLFKLSEIPEVLEGVEITARRPDANVTQTQMGTNTLTTEQIKKLPVIFGESDILKAIQLLPGVQSAGEANSGFYVRGGGPDQNLILLDDAVVYNSGHLFGFFSIFNSDAIKKATLIKGGMGANYGGRLSSVLDITMKDGNNQQFHGEGGLGLISSRLTLEGPIVKEKGSFLVSGRRTYLDVLSKAFLTKEMKKNGYYFYDANLKANYILGAKDRLYLSAYFGRDVFNFKGESGNFNVNIPWGNATTTLRWNHQWGGKLFTNTTFIYNDYNFQLNAHQDQLDIKLLSSIQDLGAKIDFDYFLNDKHTLKWGGQYTYHRFLPNQFSGKSDTVSFEPNEAMRKFGHEMAVFVLNEFDVNEAIKINAGLRYSWFTQVGPYTSYSFNAYFQKTDSVFYPAGKTVATYGGLEPRINARFQLHPSASIKASITKSMQYLHLVSNNGSTLPTDIYVPSTALVKPQYSYQYALGYFQNLFDNKVETSIEVYYKDLYNQIEYRNGYTQGLGDPEWDFVYGKAYAYGAEFFINKTQGQFTGWIGYTLSWTWRNFPQLNNGKPFPAKYDRRHDLSVVCTYELNKKWTFSSVFVFGTGNAITLPTSLYFIDGNLIQNYSEINHYRIPPYHRLDLAAVWTPKGDKPNKRYKSSWSFSIYNVYSRLNPYFMYLDMDGSLGTGGTDIKVMKVSVFPIIPSITWNFKF